MKKFILLLSFFCFKITLGSAQAIDLFRGVFLRKQCHYCSEEVILNFDKTQTQIPACQESLLIDTDVRQYRFIALEIADLSQLEKAIKSLQSYLVIKIDSENNYILSEKPDKLRKDKFLFVMASLTWEQKIEVLMQLREFGNKMYDAAQIYNGQISDKVNEYSYNLSNIDGLRQAIERSIPLIKKWSKEERTLEFAQKLGPMIVIFLIISISLGLLYLFGSKVLSILFFICIFIINLPFQWVILV
jgi:hypothetical protein